MTWTQPPLFANGDTLPQGDLNILSDDLTHLGSMTVAGTALKDLAASTELQYQLPLTTKGQLISHDGTIPALLGVGTDGQYLSAASGQTTGLQWVNAPTTTIDRVDVYKTANQNIATGAPLAALTFDLESVDTASYHDNVSNNTRLTVPSGKGGDYLIWWNVLITPYTANGAIGYLYKNGSEIRILDTALAGAAAENTMSGLFGSAMETLAQGDYLELYVRNGTGVLITINSTAPYTHFGMMKVGD